MDSETNEDWFSAEATTFGDRLSGAREEAGMSQEELARRIGVKLKTLRNWENDVSEPRANRLSMISGMLNVSLRWLLTAEGDGLSREAGLTLGPDAEELLNELYELQLEMAQGAERLARLERKLRALVKGPEDV